MATPTRFVPAAGIEVPVQLPTETYAADGAITLVAGGIAKLTKGSAGAYTLAAPYADGALLIVVAASAQAHVITNASTGFNAKGSSGTLTFGGAIGDSCILVSEGGNWYTASTRNVTPA